MRLLTCSQGSVVAAPPDALCPEGHYCAAGATAATPCPEGTYLPVRYVYLFLYGTVMNMAKATVTGTSAGLAGTRG